MSPWRAGPSTSLRARPYLAPLPRRAPPRPDPPVVCPGFGLGRSVYIGFRLSVLPPRRSGQLPSMPWRPWKAKRTVVPWANRPDGVPSCPASLHPGAHRAPPRPDPPVVCPGFGFDRLYWHRLNGIWNNENLI